MLTTATIILALAAIAVLGDYLVTVAEIRHNDPLRD
jgi:hypothetical protein